ncbi:hypothetical protein CFRS1_v006527 [Colletotrichum fructicola]|nr:hypothetical protein CFRS1_v006527 [Colletotrichum fructicola]
MTSAPVAQPPFSRASSSTPRTALASSTNPGTTPLFNRPRNYLNCFISAPAASHAIPATAPCASTTANTSPVLVSASPSPTPRSAFSFFPSAFFHPHVASTGPNVSSTLPGSSCSTRSLKPRRVC